MVADFESRRWNWSIQGTNNDLSVGRRMVDFDVRRFRNAGKVRVNHLNRWRQLVPIGILKDRVQFPWLQNKPARQQMTGIDQKACTFKFPNNRRAVTIERRQFAAIFVAQVIAGRICALITKRSPAGTVHPQIFTNDQRHAPSRFFSDALGHVLRLFEFLNQLSLFLDLFLENSKLSGIQRPFLL